MSDPAAWVYVDLEGTPRLAGRLWTRIRRGRESATFQYDEDWQSFGGNFALAPALQVGPGPHHTPTDRKMFAALGDSAPDRWGRTLIARHERLAAREEGRTPRTPREIDYLLGVSDFTRQGALRFALEEGGVFVAPQDAASVPPLVRLPELLAATRHVLADEEDLDDLRLLLAPGSSLGGARPKASVLSADGHLLIAKFPADTDGYDIVRWEAVALSLAANAGINVPEWRLETVLDRATLLVQRFDRRDGERPGSHRIPYLSAMSMLDTVDGEGGSYVEIADALRMHGSQTKADLRELWRRVVFSVLISNTDDHLRNHGFLYHGTAGWCLSPAFDLNPVPTDVKPRILATAIGPGGDPAASLELAFEAMESFDLEPLEAETIVREVSLSVSGWRAVARQTGLRTTEVDRLESAFEHEDAELARRLQGVG